MCDKFCGIWVITDVFFSYVDEKEMKRDYLTDKMHATK